MKMWLQWVMALLMAGSTIALAEDVSDADPWEGFNRGVFGFNETLDKYFLKPVAQGYDYVTPSPVRTGIGNFFNNIGELPTVANDLMQGKFKQAGLDTTRFLINTTVGFFGLMDIGSRIGLERHDEDFGQTLGYWGVGSGPYLMLPFLGPSTIRDTAGLVPDYFLSPYKQIEEDSVSHGLQTLHIIDLRASLLEAEKLVAGDRYSFFREAYLQRREFLVRDGAMPVEFDSDDDLFEDDFEEDDTEGEPGDATDSGGEDF